MTGPARGDVSRSELRVCVAASGGGHVHELFETAPAWSSFDHFLITEDTALGRSLTGPNRIYFVRHFAVGQARLGAPVRMLVTALRSMVQAVGIMGRERPDVVITTGAGAVYPSVLFARLFGAKVILIESLARFDRPSLFARIVAPIAYRRFAQAQALASIWPGYEIFDPVREENRPRPPKESLLFATVGATLPFDRLVNAIAGLKERGLLPERVIAQVGVGGAKPSSIETVETLPFPEMRDHLQRADLVLCHGGVGSLVTALKEGCRVVAMPREFERGEHYDNHQSEITRAFAARGLIASVEDEGALLAAIDERRAARPVIATTDQGPLTAELAEILATLSKRRKRR